MNEYIYIYIIYKDTFRHHVWYILASPYTFWHHRIHSGITVNILAYLVYILTYLVYILAYLNLYYPILSYPILSYTILYYPILSYAILSYTILSYTILSYTILYYPILSNPILSYTILSYPILSYPILSYPILSYPILYYPILSYTILSHPILSYPILSYTIRLEDDDDDEDFKKSQARTPSHPGKNNSWVETPHSDVWTLMLVYFLYFSTVFEYVGIVWKMAGWCFQRRWSNDETDRSARSIIL